MKFLKFSLFLFSCSWALSVQAMCRNEPEGVGLIETKVIRNNLSRDFSQAFIPDPAARNRFFFCSGGQTLSGTCPAGQEFDPFDRFCGIVSTSNPNNLCQGVRDGV